MKPRKCDMVGTPFIERMQSSARSGFDPTPDTARYQEGKPIMKGNCTENPNTAWNVETKHGR